MIDIKADNMADSLSSLKLHLESILDLFDPKSRIYYIDYPVHTNIGDLLINIGTEQFFLDYAVPIYRRYSVLNMPDISNLKADEHTTFLCHGGGNFGDLYPEHQNIREWLVENFPRARIICLPQSLYYSSPDAQRVSLEKFARHPNCHILARDQESLDMLRQSGIAQSSMMPDMAHYLWGILKFAPAIDSGKRDIYFLRQDREATSVPAELSEAFTNGSVDWKNIILTSHRILVKGAYYILKVAGSILPENLSVSIWYPMRNIMIGDAVKYFSNHDRVYTNRLHAMILGLLLGRDVVIFDNSYGKLSRYINAWLS